LRLIRLVGLVLVCTLGCSRPETGPETGASPSGTSVPLTPSAPSTAATAVGASPSAIPTPEDVEDDAARRITEQNLESELDRLEREIQAE
jgi:hypothetical protein